MHVGIMGFSGYVGQQLTQILMFHPSAKLKMLSSNSYAGHLVEEVMRGYVGPSLTIVNDDEFYKQSCHLDLAFLALPHKKSMMAVSEILKVNPDIRIIDLSADFRFNKKDQYESWYHTVHCRPDLLNDAVYGLSELNEEKIRHAKIIGNPGCYPTSVLLALMPLMDQTFVDFFSLVVDSKSGYSGGGVKPERYKLLVESAENAYPYGGTMHRHVGEMEVVLSQGVKENCLIQFTPNLIPVKRGMISNIYVTMKSSQSFESVLRLYKTYYRNAKFIKIHDVIPQMKWALGTNECHIGFLVDERTKRLVITSAIDNLIKGAAGQAVQNMNLMYNWKEDAGLKVIKIS